MTERERWRERMQARLDRLTKPPGSLGRLERLAVDLAGKLGTDRPEVDPALVLVFAGDHGVVEEGVSPYPPEVTRQMVGGFLAGHAAISVLARAAGLDLEVVAMGVAGPLPVAPGLTAVQIRPGTANFTREPAMSLGEARAAVEAGRHQAARAAARGYRTILLGEMGIGNSTAAAALTAALLDLPPEAVVGPGTGLDAAGVRHKADVVRRGLALHGPYVRDPWEALARLGGLEIAGMVGAVLEATARGLLVVLDGFITGAAALVATRLDPAAGERLLAAHRSSEPGHGRILDALGLEPVLEWGLRLGEGSGAALAFGLVRAAAAVPREMATFEEAGVSDRPDRAPADTGPDPAGPAGRPAPGLSAMDRAAVLRVIRARRDIRRFLPDPIPVPVLRRLLQALEYSPSVGFSQPWDYIVVTDPAVKARLWDLADRERRSQALYFPEAKRQEFLRLKVEGIREAPVILVATADPERMGPEVLGRHSQPETCQYSVVLGLENLWLLARAEGIGVGWVSFYQKPHLRAVLGIPPHVDPVAVLCLGYTDRFGPIPQLEEVGWAPRLDSRGWVHAERFGAPPPTWWSDIR
ncbi:MAG: nicotinate-nucleotide--dimethylbenzimidazole phosphoribosyltransferase [Actinomycetia bacterium]|nr:nicotinate-nucleotide--dimethylbenzimidazole phosphoribosyltransferase [Actinomycetes bacterium]